MGGSRGQGRVVGGSWASCKRVAGGSRATRSRPRWEGGEAEDGKQSFEPLSRRAQGIHDPGLGAAPPPSLRLEQYKQHDNNNNTNNTYDNDIDNNRKTPRRQRRGRQQEEPTPPEILPTIKRRLPPLMRERGREVCVSAILGVKRESERVATEFAAVYSSPL